MSEVKSRKKPLKTFKVNPVELLIFTGVSLVFLNSVYKLFYDWNIRDPQKLDLIGLQSASEGNRGIASTSTAQKSQFQLVCGEKQDLETTASRVLLLGEICGRDTSGSRKFKSAQILNTTNNKGTTVYSQMITGRFSSDFIPLEPGANRIVVRFTYEDASNRASSNQDQFVTIEENLTIRKNSTESETDSVVK